MKKAALYVAALSLVGGGANANHLCPQGEDDTMLRQGCSFAEVRAYCDGRAPRPVCSGNNSGAVPTQQERCAEGEADAMIRQGCQFADVSAYCDGQGPRPACAGAASNTPATTPCQPGEADTMLQRGCKFTEVQAYCNGQAPRPVCAGATAATPARPCQAGEADALVQQGCSFADVQKYCSGQSPRPTCASAQTATSNTTNTAATGGGEWFQGVWHCQGQASAPGLNCKTSGQMKNLGSRYEAQSTWACDTMTMQMSSWGTYSITGRGNLWSVTTRPEGSVPPNPAGHMPQTYTLEVDATRMVATVNNTYRANGMQTSLRNECKKAQ